MSTTTTTIQDLASAIHVDMGRGANLKGDRPRVTDGLKAQRPPKTEGLHTFTPEELLTLYVDQVAVNGSVHGYQRETDIPHARKVARAMLEGKPMPLLHIAMDGKGRMSIVDGQHRAIAAVIARVPIEGVIKRMDKADQKELFFGQRNAKKVDPNILTLAGTNPYARYVQEVFENPSHPWNGLVSANKWSKTRMAPYAMFQLLIRYVGNVETGAARISPVVEERWDRGLADELAPLIAVFGNKQTHPLAWRPFALQAIGSSAMWVFRRHPEHAGDRERWAAHMPAFPFELWMHTRTQRLMTGHLVDHWNKRLQGSRRVYIR